MTYTSTSNPYMAPCDGYVFIYSDTGAEYRIQAYINNVLMLEARQYSASFGAYASLFVRKGTKIAINNGGNSSQRSKALFYPLM